MKKKILMLVTIVVLILMSIILTGCGSDNNGNSDNDDEKEKAISNVEENTENSNSKNNTNEIDLSSVEEVIRGYYTELYENFDSEKAYKYYDYTGLYTWLKSESSAISYNSRRAEIANQIVSDYNNNKNNSELQEKINKFVEETYTDEKYKEINEEIKKDTANIVNNKKYEVIIDITNSEEITSGLYDVTYKVTRKLVNGGDSSGVKGYGGDTNHAYLISNDGKYYIISSNSRYDSDYRGLSQIDN